MAADGPVPARPRGRVVVLVSGPEREQLLPHLTGRRDLVLRTYTGPSDPRVPIESADVVLHVASADAPIANDVAALREQTRAPIVLALVGSREGLVDEALEASLSDILILPQPPDVVAFALRKAARERAGGQARLSRVIMVSSTKGGTGKTSIAVNLAVELAGVRLRTLLIDLDVQFGDVGIVLGLDRPEKTLYDLTASPGELDPEKLRGYVIAHHTGLHILPAPLRPEVGENIDATKIAAVLQTARGMYDAIVVDTAPLFDGPMLTALDRSDQLLLVSTPDVPSMKNIRLALQTLELLGFPLERVALVANRAGMAGGASVGEMADTIGREVRFVLAEDAAVPASINSGVPAVLYEPRSRFSRALKALVGTLVGRADAPFAERGVERRRRIPGLQR
ncbi:MAG TPA: AAA family ATPase [Gaiellaceae bacterium]|nr:AAA family ATPase [Gaiellaceae bacterium]